MSWIDDWYPAAVDGIQGLRGTSGPGTDGAPMATLKGIDTIGVLGQLSPAVVSAVTSFQRSQNGDFADRVVKSSANGLNDGYFDSLVECGLALGEGIPVQQYVAGYGIAGQAYKRSILPGFETFEPWAIHAVITGDEDQLFSFMRGMVDDWQRAVDASAAGIRACGADAANIVPTQELSTFWSAVRSLCSSLDVLRENPPMTTHDKIVNGAVSALHASETFAGEAAANLADEAGKAAGNVAHGFFSTAGITALVVAGIAVSLYVK